MRSMFVILLLSLAVGGTYVMNSQRDQAKATAEAAPASKTSQHDWAKQSLDRADEVKRQVAQQRKEDRSR